MATIEIRFKDLREAVAALNETDLIKEKIKLVGQKKEDILSQFMDVMEKIPNDAEGKFPGPKVCLDFYNGILDAEEKAEKENKEATDIVPPQVGVENKVQTTKPTNKNKMKEATNKKATLAEWIKSGQFTKKEIIEKYCKEFGASSSTISTMLTDAKNPKYNKFEKIVVEKDGKLTFGE